MPCGSEACWPQKLVSLYLGHLKEFEPVMTNLNISDTYYERWPSATDSLFVLRPWCHIHLFTVINGSLTQIDHLKYLHRLKCANFKVVAGQALPSIWSGEYVFWIYFGPQYKSWNVKKKTTNFNTFLFTVGEIWLDVCVIFRVFLMLNFRWHFRWTELINPVMIVYSVAWPRMVSGH